MNNKIKLCILIALSVLLVFTSFLFVYTDKAYKTSAEALEFRPIIIIDPGHGGEDSGAISEINILEKNINLDISFILRDLFISNGYDVVMTRETDTALYNKDETKHKKQSDLKNRVEVFNNSQNNIVISIHQNKFTEEKYNGTQVFYSANNKKSANLAESIKTSVVTLIQPENERECKRAGSEIYVLHNTMSPAVMVECGFLSNYAEAQKLNNKAYQTKLAYCIYLGFLEYYYTNY